MDKSTSFLNDTIENKNDYIVLGCSGGPDSMCLFDLLYKNGYKIVCAHVDHNIRPESKDEATFLENYCKDRNAIFEGLKLEKVTKNEAYYRQKRYAFYRSLAEKYHTPYIITAHHGDDEIETVLMRIARGSNLKGYGGFPKVYEENGFIYLKPLIFYTKDEILAYDKKNDIPYFIDSTNTKDDYTRNRIRHNVLPFLKKEYPNIHTKFLKYNEELMEASAYVDSIVKANLDRDYKNRVLDLKSFSSCDKFIQKKEIEYLLSKIYLDDIDKLNEKHVKSLLENLHSGKNFLLNFPNGISIKKEYDKLYFLEEIKPSTPYEVELKNKTVLPNGDVIEMLDTCAIDNSNYTTRLNSKDIKMPLYIRNRREGDKMFIKNMTGSKKIKEIFIDEKVPKSIRDDYPILTDKTGMILWLPGLRKSKFDVSFKGKYDIILKYTKKGNFDEKE